MQARPCPEVACDRARAGPPQASGFGIREASVLSEQFGRVASHLPYVGASVLPAALLEHCRRLDELAPMLASGERPSAVAWHGMAWQEQVRHRAEGEAQTRFEDGYVSGRKHFIVAAAADSVLLVSAVRGADLVWAAVGFMTMEGLPSAYVASFTDCMAVLRDPARFSSVKPKNLPGMERVDFFNGMPVMNYSDDPDHARRRRVVMPALRRSV